MSLMREVEWEACLVEPRIDPAFERRFRREVGRRGGAVGYLSGNPWIDDTIVSFSKAFFEKVSISADLTGLVGLIVSQDNSCRFCFAETRAMLRILGMPQTHISRLEHDLLTEEFDDRERAALEFARRLSRANPLPSESDLDRIRVVGYDEVQMLELASIVGLFVFFNRLTTVFALPPHGYEQLPDRWYFRIFRPLLARSLRRSLGMARPERLKPDERQGILAQVVVGLDGLPFARSLRRSLDGMWNSPLLPKRTKALVIAVVARALGCPMLEKELTELLVTEGLKSEQIAEILAHLTSSALDPVERIAIPFARETVWYEPAQIQRRGREVMKELSREQFVELVAVASIANMVCRLGIVVGVR
jgi:alkylhydroperoxidase family enzyme